VAGVTGWKENNRTTCGLEVESADQMDHVGDWSCTLTIEAFHGKRNIKYLFFSWGSESYVRIVKETIYELDIIRRTITNYLGTYVEYRAVSSVFQNIDPPPPSPPSKCVLPA
jgi:hypothetical protein